jgi:serine/threonine protein kinase
MVAVKHLKPELYSDESELTLFASEVDLMRKLSHRNIVGFVGAGEPGAGGSVGAFVVQARQPWAPAPRVARPICMLPTPSAPPLCTAASLPSPHPVMPTL